MGECGERAHNAWSDAWWRISRSHALRKPIAAAFVEPRCRGKRRWLQNACKLECLSDPEHVAVIVPGAVRLHEKRGRRNIGGRRSAFIHIHIHFHCPRWPLAFLLLFAAVCF